MKILGLSLSPHDSSAALLDNGKIISAIEEERLSRVRHCINYDNSKYTLDKEATYFDTHFLNLSNYSIKSKINKLKKYFFDYFSVEDNEIEMTIGSNLLGSPVPLENYINIDHHLAHAAHAFFSSPYEEAAVLVVDGSGNESQGRFDTISFFLGKGNKIKLLKKVTGKIEHHTNTIIALSNSIGVLYQNASVMCGFGVFGAGKLMGLASYGTPKYYSDLMKLCVKNKGLYNIDNVGIYKKILEILETQRDKNTVQNLAASVQKMTDVMVLYYVEELKKLTKQKNLCFAGGVALNGTSNYKLLKHSGFKNIYIPSAPGDGGISIGSALYGYYQIQGNRRLLNKNTPTPYLGYEYKNSDILKSIKKFDKKISYRELSNDLLIDQVTNYLIENKIIAWFQGSSEFGPRALGNRSLIASPMFSKNKDRLNKIKSREFFRPVAPVVMEGDLKRYYSVNKNTNLFMYMLFNLTVKSKKIQEIIPAVVHVDKTSRVQTLNKKQNKFFYQLLENFKKKTGTGMLINTSFNIGGEPIVETPDQAITTFLKSVLDYLVLNNFLITRK